MATVALLIDVQFGSNGTPTTEVDRSTYVKTFSFPREQDMLDVTAFGTSGFRSFAVGLQSAKFPFEMFWDTTIDAHLSGLLGYTTLVEFIYGPDGTTSGRPKYTGTMALASLDSSATVGEIKTISGEFQISGIITRTTY
jgi:hypothetical protein